MKKWITVSFFINTIGWFPFMWLCLFGANSSTEVRLTIFFTGFLLCTISGIAFTDLTKDAGFWKNNEELRSLISRHKEAIKRKEEETQKLIKKILEYEQK